MSAQTDPKWERDMAADGSPWRGLMGLTESQQEDMWLWLTKEKER